MFLISTCLTLLLLTYNVSGQTESVTLQDLLVPSSLPPTTSPSPAPVPETTIQQETTHPPTTTEAANELPTRMKIVKAILELILPLEEVQMEVVKEFLPVTVELAKLSLHYT